jgi:hypothetical protein
MSVKPNTKISFDTAPKAVGTHAYIQQVTRCRGITPSAKLVLTYCLEKYQTQTQDGRPWDFSNASIQDGTGLPQRTVYNITEVLIKSKVLKHYGQITRKTRPTILYLFNLPTLNDYLKAAEKGILTLEKDIAKPAMPTLDNANAVETTIEATPKHGDIAKDIATIAHQEEDSTKEDLQKKKEDSISTGGGNFVTPTPSSTPVDLAKDFDSYFTGSGQPSMAVAPTPSSTPVNLGEVFASYFNGGPVLPSSVGSAPVGQQNNSTELGRAPFRGLTTCPVPLYGKGVI